MGGCTGCAGAAAGGAFGAAAVVFRLSEILSLVHYIKFLTPAAGAGVALLAAEFLAR